MEEVKTVMSRTVRKVLIDLRCLLSNDRKK